MSARFDHGTNSSRREGPAFARRRRHDGQSAGTGPKWRLHETRRASHRNLAVGSAAKWTGSGTTAAVMAATSSYPAWPASSTWIRRRTDIITSGTPRHNVLRPTLAT